MKFDAETLKDQIPYYLTTKDRKALVRELKSISQGGTADYFLNPDRDKFKTEMLQSDGWRGFQYFKFSTGERRSIRGVVMSNSCDINPQICRTTPTDVTFAPLIKLADYAALLRTNDLDKQRVNARLEAIKNQKTSDMFFLPAGADGPLDEDHVVRLDKVQSMPIKAHNLSKDREKLFTLSNAGFYIFILKLSIHFCRLQENVNRKNADVR